jgi:hypothetical protein
MRKRKYDERPLSLFFVKLKPPYFFYLLFMYKTVGERLLIYDEVLPRLIGIQLECRAYGKFGTDGLIALASLRTERSPRSDYHTCQRLSDWAKTLCDLYTIDLSCTHTCKAEAVGKRIHRGGGTGVEGCGAQLSPPAPVVDLLRNVPPGPVQRPYAVVHRHPVDHIWGVKTVARS